MLRSQKDVDKHVQEIFRKISSEKERNLRCYNVAKLYFKVGDLQSAKKYVELYLKENPKAAGAHKLLGQALDGLKEYAKALEEYKCSLGLESKQPDLVLKVCELLLETKSKLAAGEVRYWMERAEEISDNHQIVFRLKEYLIKMEDGSGDQAQLTQLAEKEIEARPQDFVPRIRLLRLYLETKKVVDAYKYAIEIESRCLFRDSIQWYSCVVDVLQVYRQDVKNVDCEFHLNQLCVLERYVTLCSRERNGSLSSALITTLFALDQAIYEASREAQKGEEQILEECVKHMSGQLSFHLGVALLRLGRQSRSGWKEWTPMVWALMTLSFSSEFVDLASSGIKSSGKEGHKKLLQLWRDDGAFRCSQAGHILLNMPGESKYSIHLSGGNWREKVFKMMFAVQMRGKPSIEKSSFFLTDERFANIQDPCVRDLALYDNLGQSHRPDSLHVLVWLGLRHLEPVSKGSLPIGSSYVPPFRLSPNFSCQLFQELKLSSIALDTSGVETLNRLDVDTFLYASIFCAAAALEERHSSSLGDEGRPSLLPVDLTDPLCSDAQTKWWSCVYRLCTNKSLSDIRDVRMLVSRGLEVVRLLGNHGMDVRLVVLLAKLFSEKASSVSTPKDNISAISTRAFKFWKCAIDLLERINKNQPLRMPSHSLFSYVGKELTNSETKMLLDEGHFFIACRSMEEKKYEKAIEIFETLKNPYASFYEGLIYKKLADAQLDSSPGEMTTETKSQYVILLQKSRAALYITLDRLRSPRNAGKHPLNSELEQHLEEVESCLAREENGVISGVDQTGYDRFVDDTSRQFDDSLLNASRIVNMSTHHNLISNLGLSNGSHLSQGLTSTPLKSKTSYPTDNLNVSTQRMEARPSPERLDAQLRRMSFNTDAVMQVLLEQNRQVLDSNKSMMDALDKTRSAVQELQSQMLDLRQEVSRLKLNDGRPQVWKKPDYPNVLHPEEEYYDVGASFASFSGQPFNYDARSASNYDARSTGNYDARSVGSYDARSTGSNVPMQPILPQTLFPPLPRNMDPNSLLLSSYYPQAALGLNFGEKHGVSVSMPGAAPGIVPVPVPETAQGLPSRSTHSTVILARSGDGDSVSDAKDKSASLMGAPIMTRPTLAAPVIVDLSTSALASSSLHPQLLPAANVGLKTSSQPGNSLISSFGKLGSSSFSGETVPHNFQISMPLQPTIPTTESLEKSLSPLKPISVDAILPNVPKPAYSAVLVKQSDAKSKRLSTGSGSGNESFTEDGDYNPCADFKPVIPLPEEIVVTTGEEDETPLFVRRAKLFRFSNSEWKERGVGDIKILKHNVTGKPRILMRREQVHKICANHFIIPEMELIPQTGCSKAWTWGANDCSDGEPCIEKLCVRFKTDDDAQKFKEAFDEARSLAKVVSSPKVTSSGPVVKSDCQSSTTDGSPSSSKVQLGGFSFISPPVLKPVERQSKVTPGKDKENVTSMSKPSPFAGFSFTPISSSNVSGSTSLTSSSSFASNFTPVLFSKPSFGNVPATQSTTANIFGSKATVVSADSSTKFNDTPIFSTSSNLPDFAALAAQNKNLEAAKKETNFKGFEGAGSKVFGSSAPPTSSSNIQTDAEQDPNETEDFEPTAVFNPVIPLPSLIEVRTGEEDEDIIFEERSKLLRYDSKERQWKERGIGKMKILKHKNTGKVRLLMRREQVHKVCCNSLVTPEIQFSPLKTSDKTITWSAQDFSEGEMCLEVFALRFKTPEIMHQFKEVIERLQRETQTPTIEPSVVGKTSAEQDTKPLSELFKPKEGSWECSGCFTRNDAEKTSCPCCSQPKPGCESKVVENKPVSSSKFSFGVPSSSSEKSADVKTGTGFAFGGTKTEPLSELFKPKEGSWECSGCLTRNDAEKTSCPCCSQPKPGCESKVIENKPVSSSKFLFGVPPSNTTLNQSSESKTPFSFGVSTQQGEAKPSFTFGVSNSNTVESMKKFSFGGNSVPAEAASTGFSFGASTSSSNQPSFGSPHKFEFKLRPSSPSKSPGKSPGAPSGGEESEDETEEENVDVGDFKPVIPLPDKVPVLTGEEDETVLYCHRAKLFRLVDKEWKERGIGDIKVLSHNITKKARLLMRREQVFKICLNHYITADLEMRPKDEKSWFWAAQDFSDGSVQYETFACRFKSADIAMEFKTAVDNAIAGLIPSPSASGADSNSSSVQTTKDGSSPNVVTPTMQNFSFKLPSSEKQGVVRSLFGSNSTMNATDELEVLFEAKVTQEEKDAALKLKLPENFYLYKQAPPCSGCPGCENDVDSDQTDSPSSVEPNSKSESSSVGKDFNAHAAVFGSKSSLFSSPSFSATSSTIFGGSSSLKQSNAPSAFGGLFGAGGSTAVNSHSTAFPTLGNFSDPASKKGSGTHETEEKSDTIPFLPVSNSLSFASIAAAAPGKVAFLPTEPSKAFSFAGAGSKVFGSASSESPQSKGNNNNADSDEEPDTAEAGGNTDTHDPHFEPIIAMPDMVEVRTGEEDEEKLFCQRAKLYRYDIGAKEWKERGIGEMKILKHPLNGTYRLLLRRDQVHKVVLNQRLDPELKLRPLTSSDRAWCWGGINHAEDPDGALEELAIRFKHPEQASEFHSILEKCQEDLKKSMSSANTQVVGVVRDAEDHGNQEDDDNGDDEDDDEEYEDEEDFEIMLEKPVTMLAQGVGDNVATEGKGDIRVIMNPDNSLYVEMEDEEGKILCKAPILGDAEVQREGNVCSWKCLDLADSEDDHGVEKKFIATFESDSDADAFQDMYAKLTLEIVESTYDYVEEPED